MRISDWSSDVCSSDLGEAHALDVARQRIDLVAVVGDIRIAPHHQCRVPRRALVLGQIALEHAPNLEAVAKLETDHRIAQFARGDCLQIAFGAVYLPAVAVIAGHPAADDDAFPFKAFGERFALIIETWPDLPADHPGHGQSAGGGITV